MKTLTKPKITVNGDEITIVAKIVEQPFNKLLVTRVSHGHVNPDNVRHPRRIQSSNEAVFIESPAGKFAMPNEVIAAIAAHACPESSFAPVFVAGSTPDGVKVTSETEVTYQWQVSDNPAPIADKPNTSPPEAVWTDIPTATNAKLDQTLVAEKKWVRCVATNLTGKTISKPIQKQ